MGQPLPPPPEDPPEFYMGQQMRMHAAVQQQGRDSELFQWRTASGTWFGETSRQSQAEPVKQQHTGISPNHVPEAVPY